MAVFSLLIGEGEAVEGVKEANIAAECSAKRNRGVNEAFTEAARVALSVKGASGASSDSKCVVM